MGHGLSKKKALRIAQLKLTRKRAFWRAAIAMAVIIVLLVLKTMLLNLGVEWVSSPFVNISLFVLALIAAGVVGIGVSKMKKASDQLKTIRIDK